MTLAPETPPLPPAVRPLTRNQKLVFDRLAAAGGPVKAYALLESLREEGFRAPPQVYRALDHLMAEGLVHRIESLNAFVACVHPDAHAADAVVFMLCEVCGTADEFGDAGVSAELAAVCRRRGFSARQRTVELRGACNRCTPPGPNPPA